jgi:hypothetical protein
MNVSLNSRSKKLSNNLNEQLPSEKVVDTGQFSNHKAQNAEPHPFLVSMLHKGRDAFCATANFLQPRNIIRAINPKNFVRLVAVSNLFSVAGARPNPAEPNYAPRTALAQGGVANHEVGQEAANIEHLKKINPNDNLQQKFLTIGKDQEESSTMVNNKLDKFQMIIDSVILKNAKKFISINDLSKMVAHFNKEEINKGSTDRAQLTFFSGCLHLSVVSVDTGYRSRSLEYSIDHILDIVLSNIGVFRGDNVENTGEINGMSLEKISVLDQAMQEKNPAVDDINNIATDISNAPNHLTKEQEQVIREKLDEIYENVIVSKRDLQEKKEALHQKLKDNHNELIIGYYIGNGQPKIDKKLANNIYQQFFPDKTNTYEIVNDYSQNIISQQASKIKLSHPHITTKNNHHATIRLERNGNELEVTSVIIQEKHSKEEFNIIQTIRDNKISHPTEIIRLVNELAGNGDIFIDGEDKNITSKNTRKTNKGILKQYTKMIQRMFSEKGIIYRNNNQNKPKHKTKLEL